MSPEEELALLENDERLDSLLDLVDDGKALSAEDQAYVDQTLDRIDVLMEILGIELGDDEDDEEEREERRHDAVAQARKSKRRFLSHVLGDPGNSLTLCMLSPLVIR